MNTQSAYAQFALVREMLETSAIIKNFKLKNAENVVAAIKKTGTVFFTGEGSSRIFPAKNAMLQARRMGLNLNMATEGSRQAMEYKLDDSVVFGASNSGQTKEVIALFDMLKSNGHKNLYALTANHNTKLESLSNQTFVLGCGKEDAVAATKSVEEQALFYYALLLATQNQSVDGMLAQASAAVHDALTTPIDQEIVKSLSKAGTICFSGRNDGVAEELTLKTNEITRKKSDYFEGTYAVHGVEEVLNADDVVLLINPFRAECEKIKTTLVDGVKMKVFAIAEQETGFPTIKIKNAGDMTNFVYLAAGWNLLVEVGIHLGINLDKPTRARKVGNEFVG
jgi:glucosamine--fructose-6-phosphate aminotransferase (isomerizing)